MSPRLVFLNWHLIAIRDGIQWSTSIILLIDFNEGFVLPVAIDRRTFVAAATNGSDSVQVQSFDLNQTAAFALHEPNTSLSTRWLGYIAGVAFELEKGGVRLSGSDIAISSDVPIGAGLSSSAALEIAAGSAFLALNGARLDANSLALAAQKAEHTYVGTRCGIMDQLTVSVAQKSHALLIDCRSLEVKHIDLNLSRTMI